MCHLLNFIARQQRKVVRATFSADLLSVGDATDRGIVRTRALHEVDGRLTSGRVHDIDAKLEDAQFLSSFTLTR